MTPTTLQQVLTSCSRRDLLQCLAVVQARQARDALLLRLLQDRLAQLTSPPASKNEDNDQLLTVKDVATLLRVSVARGHELVRTKAIPSVRLGTRQIRVRRSDLDHALASRPTYG